MSFKNIDEQTWLGGTGASSHMTNSLKGMRNLQANNSHITVGNGEHLYAPKIGDKVGCWWKRTKDCIKGHQVCTRY